MFISIGSIYTLFGAAVAFLGFFARVVWQVTSYKKDLDVVKKTLGDNNQSIEFVQKQLNENQLNYHVRLVQLETDIQWIKTTLIKIDQKLS